MQKFQSMGLGGLVAEPAAYSVDSEIAISAWRFLGGWFPERLGLFLALQPVADIGSLLEGLMAIRESIDAHQRTQS